MKNWFEKLVKVPRMVRTRGAWLGGSCSKDGSGMGRVASGGSGEKQMLSLTFLHCESGSTFGKAVGRGEDARCS